MKTVHKLAASVAVLVGSVFLLRVDGWFGLSAVVALPLAILLWFDLGRELRNSPSSTTTVKTIGLLMGVPQALFGVVCLAAGIAIVCWVLYNSLWKRDPSYTGGFLTFGIGPVLALLGLGFMIDAFKKKPPSNGA